MPGDIVSGFTVARLVSKGDSTREQKSIEKATRAELTGKSPDVVANTVFRILQKKNPPLRVSVGFGNKLLALLVKLLPIRLTDFLVNKIYCDDSTK